MSRNAHIDSLINHMIYSGKVASSFSYQSSLKGIIPIGENEFEELSKFYKDTFDIQLIFWRFYEIPGCKGSEIFISLPSTNFKFE